MKYFTVKKFPLKGSVYGRGKDMKKAPCVICGKLISGVRMVGDDKIRNRITHTKIARPAAVGPTRISGYAHYTCLEKQG